jgi:hypothetical protein
MITGGNREAADTDALSPGSFSGECPQRISFAFPSVARYVAPVLVFLSEAHVVY